MQTNPNGVPTLGNQYLLGIQVAGIAGPTFLGSNLINFTGAVKNTTTTASGSFYTPHQSVVSDRNQTLATTGDASYVRKNDSYFASPWQTLLASPNGAGETRHFNVHRRRHLRRFAVEGSIQGHLRVRVR